MTVVSSRLSPAPVPLTMSLVRGQMLYSIETISSAIAYKIRARSRHRAFKPLQEHARPILSQQLRQ